MEKIKKLKPETQVIYTDGKTMMEITKVVEINKQNQTAKLANKVTVSRVPSGFTFSRIDGKEGYALAIIPETQQQMEAFRAYHSLKRKLEIIRDNLRFGWRESDPDYIIALNEKL